MSKKKVLFITGAGWHGFREPFPTHIDTTLVPVRPGLVLTNP